MLFFTGKSFWSNSIHEQSNEQTLYAGGAHGTCSVAVTVRFAYYFRWLLRNLLLKAYIESNLPEWLAGVAELPATPENH